MPSVWDRLWKRKELPEPEGLYSPPERGAQDPEPSDFNVGDTVRAMGTAQSGAPAVADGVRRPLPDSFVVPDKTNGTIKGVDKDKIFVAFPVEVPSTPWRHTRSSEGPEFDVGDRLKAIEPVSTPFGTIPKGHIVNVLDAQDTQLRVSLMLQFLKADWWNMREPDLRRWGSRGRGRRRTSPKRRKPNENRRRIFREVWYKRDGSSVARSGAYGNLDGARPCVLKPGAKVIDVSNDTLRKNAALDEDVQRLVSVMEQQATAITNLTDLVNRLMGGQSNVDAIRTEDRLIVLNPEALQDEAPPRQHWIKKRSRHEGDEAPKASTTWAGLPVSIEYLAGDRRPPHNNTVPAPYGYIDDTKAIDGDSVDIMIGPGDRDIVWVFEQLRPDDSGTLQQYKTLVGFDTADEATDAFLAMWPEHMMGDHEETTAEDFVNRWLPLLNTEDPQERSAAGIVDLQGIDAEIAQDMATAGLSGDWDPQEAKDRMYSVLRGKRVGDFFPEGFLQTPEADARFRNVMLAFMVSPFSKELGHFTFDTRSDRQYIRLNLHPLFRVFQDPPSLGRLATTIQTTLTHELRHAADWAYQGAESYKKENPAAAAESQSTKDAYYNSPTELRSHAGNAADRLWQTFGSDALRLGGRLLYAYMEDHSPAWPHIRPENRKEFVQRVLKALEQKQ